MACKFNLNEALESGARPLARRNFLSPHPEGVVLLHRYRRKSNRAGAPLKHAPEYEKKPAAKANPHGISGEA